MRERIKKILDEKGYKYDKESINNLEKICNETMTDEEIFTVIINYRMKQIFGEDKNKNKGKVKKNKYLIYAISMCLMGSIINGLIKEYSLNYFIGYIAGAYTMVYYVEWRKENDRFN